MFYHEKKSWGDARSTCQAVNGDLIINLDDKKQNLIAGIVHFEIKMFM